jgi:hypothetical protein
VSIDNKNTELINWYNTLQEKFPISDENIYLPEYEIKMRKDNIRIQAKYDLIIIKPNNKIEIWDWKTEKRKLDYKEVCKRMQAIIYMYIINYSESIHRIHEEKIMELIRRLDNYDFGSEFNSELYSKQCKYCEFAGGNHVCDAFVVKDM